MLNICRKVCLIANRLIKRDMSCSGPFISGMGAGKGSGYRNDAEVIGWGAYQIGYLSKMLAALTAPILDKGIPLQSGFREVRGGFGYIRFYGMEIELSFAELCSS